MGIVGGLLLGLLWGVQPAWAEEPPSGEAVVDPVLYTGRRVLSRSLVAPLGGLPDEDLEPLLRVRQDGLYSPQDVRQDIATLTRVGDFAQVEVLVEPWVQPGPDGEPEEGVYVTYQVYPPPRLERIWVEGNRAIGKSALQRLAGLESGQIFFPEQAAVVQQRIQDAYVEKGWVDAVVQVSSSQSSDRRVQLKVRVEEGEPQRLQHIEVRRRDALSRFRVRTLLWKNGIFVGRPYKDSSLHALEE
ncbi:MAG TPA: POTRA domain-containing protein, partial [Myxococcota bacterium]|nr:POTRA domain-containing protein [Myxococcota bacterium]